MAAPPSTRLQSMLQAAVQSVKWSYSLFWQICPQQGILIWGDGYYNGPIKTRKTVNPMEVSTDEASLQRSQQLRELYESLSAGETDQPARRPCASLSPEDLTETEWFYLMCVSFSYPPGVGLPGKAYARRQHVWLTGANEVDSKTFSRAILAKSACIQTVVCIPLLDGVVELGTTERVPEDLGLTTHVKTFFIDHNPPHPPKPALSEHSTSNPATSSGHPNHPPSPFHSPAPPSTFYVPPSPHRAEEEEEDEEEEEEEEESDSEAETAGGAANQSQNPQVGGGGGPAVVEPSELMQLEMSEDIRLGSPDDGSNNLDSDFHMLTVNHQAAGVNDLTDHQRRVESFRAESTRRWQMAQDSNSRAALQIPPNSVPPPLDDLSQEDTHYSQTVSTVLHNQPGRFTESSSTHVSYSTQSAFSAWTARSDHLFQAPTEATSQWLLKYILFSVPFLHNKYRDETTSKSREDEGSARVHKSTPQDELSANHVLAERRRREKLNERFIILRSLVPFVTKMDKASILGDTIEYVKQLRKKIQDLESRNRQVEADHRSRLSDPQRASSSKEQKSGVTAVERARSALPDGLDKRKMRIVEGSACGKPKAVESPPQPPPPLPPPPPVPTEHETSIQVSIIEGDALLELQCPHREGLLLDVMQILRDLRIETTAVQSSLSNGFFVAELRAKVKEIVSGRKPSIVEVKRAMQQLIPHTDS